MMIQFPPPAAIVEQAPAIPYPEVYARLKAWNPQLDIEKLRVRIAMPVTWNDGSLGCALEGHYYTQALVPGYLFVFEIDGQRFEVHTNESMSTIAIPGIGYI